MNKPKRIEQAHGLTHDEMSDLQYNQLHGKVEMMDANNASDEAIKNKHFKEFVGHQIPVHENHIYHVVAETLLFDQPTGDKISTPVIGTFTKESYRFHKAHNGFAGQAVHILHNPEFNEVAPTAKNDDEDDELGEMKVADLRAKYLELTGQEAPAGIRKADLIELINGL